MTKFKALIIALAIIILAGASYTLTSSLKTPELPQETTTKLAQSDCPPAPEACSSGLNVWAAADHAQAVKVYLDHIAWAAAVEAEEARLAAENRISVAQVREVRSRCNGDFYNCFKECTIAIEAPGQRYATNTGNGYYGAYQFNQNTWEGAVSRAGHPEYAGTTANNAPPEVQDAAAAQLYAERGNQPWGGRC